MGAYKMAQKKQEYWQKQLENAYANPLYKKWIESSKNIARRYRNQAFVSNDTRKKADLDANCKGYNLLYRNAFAVHIAVYTKGTG